MAIFSRTILKTFYETGDIPTQQEFADFIDSCLNLNDDVSNFIATSRKVIPTAKILTLFDTPVEILPTPGVGLSISLLNWKVSMEFNTTKYAAFTNMELIFTAATERVGINSSVLASTQDVFQTGELVTSVSTNDTNVAPNEPLILKAITGNPTTGDSDIVIYTNFTIFTV